MNARARLLPFALLFLSEAALAHITVVATLPDLAALAKEVGGEHATVSALANPREDPHYVDPRPSHIVTLNRADLLVLNGLSLEKPWLDPLLVQARNPRIQVGAPGYLDASTVITSLYVPSGPVDRSMGDVHPGGNPHFLFDPRRAAEIAIALGGRMAALDPKNADAYRGRASAYATKLRTFADEKARRFRALPPEKRRVVSYHESLVYLYDWLGLEAIATVEPKPGIPPDPAHVARVLSLMKKRGARAIVQEEFYPTQTSKTLARLAEAELVVLPGGTRVKGGERYHDHLEQITEALHAALAR